MHPSIERRGAPFAAAAGLDTHRKSGSLDDLTQAYFLLNEEPRQTNTTSPVLGLLPLIPGYSFSLHEAFLPLYPQAISR
jgi:hypothetical protein